MITAMEADTLDFNLKPSFHKGIIYTPDKEIGRSKLLDIEREKNDSGIATVVRRFSTYLNDEIRFADGETWEVVKPNDSARGYRWSKAWVDKSNTTEEQLELFVLSKAAPFHEPLKYFNM